MALDASLGVAGLRSGICTSSTRPAVPYDGMMIYETDTKKTYVYNGTTWISYGNYGSWDTFSPGWTASPTPPAIGNGSIAGRYCQIGKQVSFEIGLSTDTTTTYGSGAFLFAVPVAAYIPSPASIGQSFSGWAYDASANAMYTLNGYFTTSTQICAYTHGGGTMTSNNPMVWTTSDQLHLHGTYEAA